MVGGATHWGRGRVRRNTVAEWDNRPQATWPDMLPILFQDVEESRSRPCGALKSWSGPSGTIRVGLMSSWVM